MITRELIQALKGARLRMTSDAWMKLASKIAQNSRPKDDLLSRQAIADLSSPDAGWILHAAMTQNANVPGLAFAAAMMTVDELIAESTVTELIWTGPTHDRFPVRRIDQVLYDLVVGAKKRILLVTFAAHRIRHLCLHLTEAVQRGVELTLIVESEEESKGQLSRDAADAFRDIPLANANIYCWPIEKRERNQAGYPGKLHVKCAIVDEVALIGSANLTDDALNRNMELGVLLRDRIIVEAISGHFHELIHSNILEPVKK